MKLSEQSPYQKIELKTYGNSYSLSLNGVSQFHSAEEAWSHEWMVAVPMALSKQNKSVLILGGGDGLAAREAIKCGAEEITVVELDPVMIEWTKENPLMRELSNNSFHNSKVKIINDDAIQYVLDSKKTFDIIIDDCEYDIENQPSNLDKYFKYLQKLPKLLNNGGVGSLMAPEDIHTNILSKKIKSINPKIIKELNMYHYSMDKIAVILKTIYPNAKCQEIVSEGLGKELYCYFSNGPIKQRRPLKTSLISSIDPLIDSDLLNKYKI